MTKHTPKDRAKHIARAKELLQTVRNASMSTVNEDGSPHNTPFRFLYAPDLSRICWGSHPGSLHSRNVTRTGQVFVVLYEANVRGGLYIKAENAHALEGDELQQALQFHNSARTKSGEVPINLSYYQGSSPQRMWAATPTNFWVNGSLRDEHGFITEDVREEVTVEELLA